PDAGGSARRPRAGRGPHGHAARPASRHRDRTRCVRRGRPDRRVDAEPGPRGRGGGAPSAPTRSPARRRCEAGDRAMTRVGGVISGHNQINWAEAAIRSLASEVEDLVVVDDGSSDGSTELVLALADELGFRALRHSSPRGVSESYNAAVEALTAQIVLIQGG